MKRKIFIYGDSYSEFKLTRDGIDSNFTWPQLLNNNGYHVISNAVGGSSTEYSFLKFIKDTEQKIFKSQDIVIFQFSYLGRYNFKYQLEKCPSSAWYNKMIFTNDDLFLKNNWYKKNKDFLIFYEENRSLELDRVNHISYCHVIKTFAELNKDILVIIFNVDDIMNFYNIEIKNTDNFLISDLSLHSVSCNELQCSTRIFKDIRPNHLTLPNLKIFADLIDTAIKNKNIDHIKQDKFLSNIYPWPKFFNDVKNLISLKILPNDYNFYNLKKYFN